mgnify:CR=1 FL=1
MVHNAKWSSSARRACVLSLIGFSVIFVSESRGRVVRPNIVTIIVDDAGYADFGFTSAMIGLTTEFKTPNLDALAAQSVILPQAYVTSSVCTISRAGLLTGRYPQRFGMHYNGLASDLPYEGIPEGESLIFEQMKTMGYTTGAIGKWHVGEQPQWRPTAQGVDHFFGFWEGNIQYFRSDAYPYQIRRGDNAVAWWNDASLNGNANDPVLGRYATDAFADEASQFIATNAATPDPFFLYVALNAPHAPFQAKSADLAEFDATSLTGTRKTVAAMTLAMDRAIGQIVNRLHDPNGDGDQSDSVIDNTIIMFTNDNGAPTGGPYSNGFLEGGKGTGYEGGTRVPAFIIAPGLAAGASDKPGSMLAPFPTFPTAGPGPLPHNLAGGDLMPYLTGANTGSPHQYLYQYTNVNFASAQDSQWKLVKPTSSQPWQLYRLNPDGTGETSNVASQNPEKVVELARAFVAWEVGVDKPLNSTSSNVNRTNVFTYRQDAVSPTANWNFSAGWMINDPTERNVTMRAVDSTSQLTVVFQPSNIRSYTAINNLNRGTLNSSFIVGANPNIPELGGFLLNELRMSGDFASGVNRSATLQGTPFMFANSPNGDLAKIAVQVNDLSSAADFTYNVNADVVLFDDLHFVGAGGALVNVNGVVRDYDQPRSLYKWSAGRVVLTAANSYQGDTVVGAGVLELAGSAAAISNDRYLIVQNGGEFRLTSGAVQVQAVSLDNGGDFLVAGGFL